MSADAERQRFAIYWLDAHRKASEPPDPAWPDGVAVDVSGLAARTCEVELPWPATGCGTWIVLCLECRYRAALTAAGRPDDPISVRMPCKPV